MSRKDPAVDEASLPSDRGVAEADLALHCAQLDRYLAELPKATRDPLKATLASAIMAATVVGMFDAADAAATSRAGA